MPVEFASVAVVFQCSGSSPSSMSVHKQEEDAMQNMLCIWVRYQTKDQPGIDDDDHLGRTFILHVKPQNKMSRVDPHDNSKEDRARDPTDT